MTPWVLLLAQQSDMTATAAKASAGGPAWVVAVNLVIWTGIFLYLLRLERRAGRKELER